MKNAYRYGIKSSRQRDLSVPPITSLVWCISDPVVLNVTFDFKSKIEEYPLRRDLLLQLNEALYADYQRGLSVSTLNARYGSIKPFLAFLDEIDVGCKIVNLSSVNYDFLYAFYIWYKIKPIQSGNRKGKNRRDISAPTYIVRLLATYAELHCDLVHDDVISGHLPFLSNIPSTPRQPYSSQEIRQILRACREIVSLDMKGEWTGASSVVLSAAAVLMSVYTLANISDILRMTKDSMYPHPQDPDRRVCFVFEKPRAGYRLIRKDFSSEPPSELEISMESRLFHGKSKELFEYLKNRSDSLRDQAPEAIKDSIWLYKSSNRIQLNEPIRNITSAYLNTFKSKIQKGFPPLDFISDLYDLKDSEGKRLKIRVSRIRPSCAQMLRRYASIASLSRLLGHKMHFGQAGSKVTVSHYLPTSPQQKVRFQLLVENLGKYALSGSATTWVINQRSLSLTAEQQETLGFLESDQRFISHVAHCKNNENEYQPESSGPKCLDFMQCLLCSNLVILESDLWRLFSFGNALRRDFESGRIPSLDWSKRYGIFLDVVEREIPHAFRHRKHIVDEAKMKAIQKPYPLWEMQDSNYISIFLTEMENSYEK